MKGNGRLKRYEALHVNIETARPYRAEYDRKVKVDSFYWVIESLVKNYRSKPICRLNIEFLIEHTIHDVAYLNVSEKSVRIIFSELATAG